MISKLKPRLLIETYFWVLAAAWTVVVGGFLLFGIIQIRHVQQEMAENEAYANFNKDQALRLWSTTHGGVYVPVTDKTPPNPHLQHVEDRDIKTPAGKPLTLMNPAYMLRQVMEEHERLYGVRGHITSLKYFSPETAPDDWEKSALQAFERSVKEVSEFATMGGRPCFRYMAPMRVEEGCLKCHGHQGYKVGDIRGGVSVSVPMAKYLGNQRRQTIAYVIALGFLWLLGLSGVIWAKRKIQQQMRQQEDVEMELQIAHDVLEQRVEQRTAQLKDEIERRKQTETEINAALKEKEILLQEVHHRVKNNMQIITSLLKLQAGKITDKHLAEIFRDAENRVRSMALIHETLYQTKDFANINFNDYVETISNHLFRNYATNPDKVSLKREIEDISLGLDNAIPCGLIVNELISNALKYAFPEDRIGEIKITLHATNDDQIELTVSDNGIGIPAEIDMEKTESLGLQLVQLLAENQLDGTLELDRDGGTAFRIRFER
jgi:two-component sensor histidine kinase